MVAAETLLGVGLYSPSEAAFYARVRPQLLSNWVCGTKTTEPVIERQLLDASKRIVTFLDFIQTLAIRRMRLHSHVSLQKIREGYQRKKKSSTLSIRLRTRPPGSGCLVRQTIRSGKKCSFVFTSSPNRKSTNTFS